MTAGPKDEGSARARWQPLPARGRNHNHKYRATSAYNNRPYHREEDTPDPRCLSYTHDRDFSAFKPYPKGKEEFEGRGWCPPAHACYDAMDSVFSRGAPGRGTVFKRPKEEL